MHCKRPRFWVVVVSVVIVIGVGIVLLSNRFGNEPDLSFLNPDNMLSLLGEQDELKVESSVYGNTYVSGVEFSKWLDIAKNDWKIKKVSSPYELSPDIIIHVNDETGNEIRLYQSEPTLTMTLYQNEFRYYKIPAEDYLTIAAMAGSGYPRVQSLTFTEHENGMDNLSVTITNSNTIMRMAVLIQSGEKYNPSLLFDSTQNDSPPVSEYIRIEMIGDETYHDYYLYSKNGNDYFIDQPYDHINKIDFNTLKEIITIFTSLVSENNMHDEKNLQG